MASVISRLRKTHPYLTPGWGDTAPIVAPPPAIRRGVPLEAEPYQPEFDLSSIGMPRVEPSTETPPVMTSGTPPAMVIRRRGRPTDEVLGGGSDLDRQLARRRAIEDYQPQNESIKHLLGRTALNFVARGIPGAAMTVGSGLLDRKAGDRAWKEQQLESADERIGRLGTERRAQMQEEQIAHPRGWISDVNDPSQEVYGEVKIGQRRPAPGQLSRDEQRRDDLRGTYQAILSSGQSFSEDNPEHKQIHDAAQRLGITLPYGKKAITAKEPIPYERKNPDGSTTRLQSFDNGKTWVESGVGSAAQLDRTDIRGSEERIRKAGAATRKLASLVEQERNAASEKDKAFTELGRLQSLWNQAGEGDEGKEARKALEPQLQAAKERANQAQSFYVGFGAKKLAAQAEIDENASGEAQDPQVKAYADKFFKGDYSAALAAIQKQRGQ